MDDFNEKMLKENKKILKEVKGISTILLNPVWSIHSKRLAYQFDYTVGTIFFCTGAAILCLQDAPLWSWNSVFPFIMMIIGGCAWTTER
jgi:hypothetical protein